MEPWATAKKSYACVKVPPAPVRVHNQWPYASSVTSVMSLG